MVQFSLLYSFLWSSTASHGVYVDRLLFRFLPLFFDFLKIPAARLSSMRARSWEGDAFESFIPVCISSGAAPFSIHFFSR